MMADMKVPSISPEERARRSAEAMWANDDASKALGMVRGEVLPGRATVSLTVARHHANGHGICHGGIIFALADTAFALACNSDNRVSVAQHNSITFVMPARLNDDLRAVAVAISEKGRSGVCDVRIANQDDETIALFRGCCRHLNGTLFDEPR